MRIGRRRPIDLNADVGEGFPFDALVLGCVSSANVCCGVHAGSTVLTKETVQKCRDAGIVVGAHPGIPDRQSMGRAPLEQIGTVLGEKYLESLMVQTEFLVRLGAQYIKPHGSFYNESAKRDDVWTLLCTLVVAFRLPLVGLAGTLHEEAAAAADVAFVREGFVDRAYRSDGMLVPRSQPGAVIHDPGEASAQALRLVGSVDSICVHGDTLECVTILRAVREALEDEGYEVRPCV